MLSSKREKQLVLFLSLLLVFVLYHRLVSKRINEITKSSNQEIEYSFDKSPASPLLSPLPTVTSPFLLALENYELIHQNITQHKQPIKIVRMSCGDFCGGWGDRLKGIFNVIALGLLLDRAFIVQLRNADMELAQLYQSQPINWNYEPKAALKTLNIRCIDTTCACVTQQLGLPKGSTDFLQQFDEIVLVTNQDCSGYLFRESIFSERRKYYNIDQEPTWRGIVYSRYFQPTPLLSENIHKIIKQNHQDKNLSLNDNYFPKFGLHVRTGLIQGDPQRFTGELNALLQSYVDCLQKTQQQSGIIEKIAFIAVDNPSVLNDLTARVKNIGFQVLDGNEVGELGHVERFASVRNLAVRMHAEFEILRHVKYLLTGQSGFSLYAYKTRILPDAEVFASYEGCRRVFQDGKDHFTVAFD